MVEVTRGEALTRITWLRNEVYPGLVRHPLDDDGIATWICERYTALRQVHDETIAPHVLFAEIYRHVNPPAPPGPSEVYRRPAGQLRRDGRAVRDDAGHRLLLSFSHFHATTLLQHAPAIFHDNIAAAREHRLGAQRILCVKDWPEAVQDEGPQEPDHFDRIRAAVQHAYHDGGILTDACLFGAANVPGIRSLAEAVTYARTWGRKMRDLEHMLAVVVVANEPGDRSIWPWGGVETLRQVAAAVRAELPSVMLGLGAAYHPQHGSATTGWRKGGTEDGENACAWFGTRHGYDVVSLHGDRGGTAERNGRQGWIERRDGTEGHEGVVYSEEDIGPWNYPPGRGPNLNDADLNGMIATSRFAVGLAMHCYHTGAGIGYSRAANVRNGELWFPLRWMPGLDRVAACLDVLPPTLPNWQIANWHWSLGQGQVFETLYTPSDADGDAPTRGHCAISSTGEFVRHEFVVGREVRLKARVGLEATVWQRQGAAFVDVGQVRLKAGEALTLAPAVEYLIKGRV